MKIRRLVISDFGKYHQQELTLSDGLNIATGANESGKTTLRRFIRSMFYGLERERGIRARNDDYTRYKPWESGRFQGMLEFEAEGKEYRLFRNFLTTEKEAVLTELSSGKGLAAPDTFLKEQGIPSEAVYENTFWIGNECATEEVLAEELRSYLANAARSGGAGLNLQKSLAKLAAQKKQLEKQIPEQEIVEAMELMMKGRALADRLAAIRTSKDELLRRCSNAETSIKKYKAELEIVTEKKTVLEKELKRQKKKEGLMWGCVPFWIIVLLLGAFLFQSPVAVMTGAAVCGIGLCITVPGAVYIQRKGKTLLKKQEGLLNTQELLQKELQFSYEELTKLLPEAEQEKMRLEQAEEQVKVCEAAEKRYEILMKEKKERMKEIAAVEFAINTLNRLSADLYEEFGAKFIAALSGYARDFTDHAYVKLTADENLTLRAVTEDRTVTVTDVSFGTGQQFYLALRFAAADVFDPEKKNMIILDDSFASFDGQRLESALLALSKCGRQILILSSTGREEALAKRMGITYEAVF